MIALELSRGRNAVGIWQDLVDRHGFAGGYQSVKRFVRALHGASSPEARVIIETRPGEECQVDYGTGPMVRDPDSGKYRRTRLFVMTLGCSRKSVRLLTFKSSSRIWAELHEQSFRRLGGSTRVVVLDNLREGVLSPDIYDPGLNPLYRDVLAHYSVTALPCKVRDPDRKGKVESGVNHAQMTPLKGKKFESLKDAQAYLDHWESHWADTRIHGRTKRQVAAMFAEEKPFLQALPLEPFRYYQYGVRTVHLDGCVEVEAAYYGAPPGWVGRQVNVQWDAMFVRLLDPRTGQLLREHLSGKRGGHRIRDEDRPRRTPPQLLQLLARAHKAGVNIGTVCDAIHARQGELGTRRILGVLDLTKQYGSAACDGACAVALELRVPEYRFVSRYLERSLQAPLSLRQIDPLIRNLTEYRDVIQQRIDFEESKS
jgi:transposase